jgi:SAM-dependent methyltransferase
MDFVLQDPFTRHCRQKPRGYPGDAELLDIVYREPGVLRNLSGISELGQQVFEYTSNVTGSKAVRARKELLAREIEAASSKGKCRILSVACGHLRELGLITPRDENSFAEFVGFDQDQLSLEVAEQAWRHFGVSPVMGTVRDLIRSKFEGFDLIYAAGLYDYLQPSTARKLTAKLFDLLNSTGTLVVANFLPDIWESGYMEAVMDWWLLQRSLEEIGSFIDGVSLSQISAHTVRADIYDRIGYLKVTKV